VLLLAVTPGTRQDRRHEKEVAAVGEKTAEAGITHVAPRLGESVWIGDRELVTFKEKRKGTGGRRKSVLSNGGYATFHFRISVCGR
jgi:hypothetical protein